jgi:pre-mRNA splicing factor component
MLAAIGLLSVRIASETTFAAAILSAQRQLQSALASLPAPKYEFEIQLEEDAAAIRMRRTKPPPFLCFCLSLPLSLSIYVHPARERGAARLSDPSLCRRCGMVQVYVLARTHSREPKDTKRVSGLVASSALSRPLGGGHIARSAIARLKEQVHKSGEFVQRV